jgi:hypothetical protein
MAEPLDGAGDHAGEIFQIETDLELQHRKYPG